MSDVWISLQKTSGDPQLLCANLISDVRISLHISDVWISLQKTSGDPQILRANLIMSYSLISLHMSDVWISLQAILNSCCVDLLTENIRWSSDLSYISEDLLTEVRYEDRLTEKIRGSSDLSYSHIESIWKGWNYELWSCHIWNVITWQTITFRNSQIFWSKIINFLPPDFKKIYLI